MDSGGCYQRSFPAQAHFAAAGRSAHSAALRGAWASGPAGACVASCAGICRGWPAGESAEQHRHHPSRRLRWVVVAALPECEAMPWTCAGGECLQPMSCWPCTSWVLFRQKAWLHPPAPFPLRAAVTYTTLAPSPSSSGSSSIVKIVVPVVVVVGVLALAGVAWYFYRKRKVHRPAEPDDGMSIKPSKEQSIPEACEEKATPPPPPPPAARPAYPPVVNPPAAHPPAAYPSAAQPPAAQPPAAHPPPLNVRDDLMCVDCMLPASSVHCGQLPPATLTPCS